MTIPKPGKLLEEVSSYRPISLLPITSKIFEKAMLKNYARYEKKKESYRTTSLNFDSNTPTIETSAQNYRDTKRNLRKNQHCSMAFLNIT
jgi:hypothetical protein